MRPLGAVVLSVVSFVAVALTASRPTPAQADPVETFIVRADSIVGAGDEEAFAAFVAANDAVAGAAVGLVMDVAIEIGDGGDPSAEAENVAFAERVAEAYFESTGSTVLADLVRTYSAWTPSQREVRRRAKALEVEATEARGAGDLAVAEQKLREALDLYLEIGDDRSHAIVWGSLGVVAFFAQDWEALKSNYQNALRARRAIEDRILEGRTLNGLGSAHLQTGELDTAVDYYRQAIELRLRTGDVAGLATSYTYLGHTYSQMGRIVDAREQYANALPMVEAAGQPARVVDLLISVGNLRSKTGRLREADESYRRAVEIARDMEDPGREASCRVNRGVNLRLEGRYREAFDEFAAAEALVQDQGNADISYFIHIERARLARLTGDLDRAREDVLAAIERAAALDNPLYDVESLINLGLIYKDLGAFERSVDAFEKARDRAEAVGLDYQLREVRDFLAEVEIDRGMPERALALLEANLTQDEAEGLETRVVQNELMIATAEAVLGRGEAARDRLQRVFPRAVATGNRQLKIAACLTQGHAFEVSNADSAAHYYEAALHELEQGRMALGGTEVQTGYLSGERRRLYEEIARFYARQAPERGGDWSDRAFRTIERGKSRGLLDLIETTVAAQGSEAEGAVLDSLYRLESQPDATASTRAALERRYTALRQARVDAATAGLRQTDIPGTDAVRRALPKKTVLIQYALGDTASFAWIIDRRGADLHELPARGVLKADVEQLKAAVRAPGRADETLRVVARKLYRQLVEPFGSRIEKAKTLVIVPDGVLFEVPFDLLLTEDAAGEVSWDRLPYLARTHATVYSPSAAVFLRLLERKSSRYPSELLAVGDPDFSSLESSAGRSPLAPLPYTREELAKIGETVDRERRELIIGTAVSEGLLKSRLRDGSPRVLHLATHGLVDPVEPTASSVALGVAPGSSEDGYLHTLEVLSLPLESALVVLSACDTGRGKISRGEGVVGLSRAFIASGAGGVVASLWAVSDESTAVLMKHFYQEMFGRKRPAGRALHEARLALMSEPAHAHPFYWSPFIIIGTGKVPW